MSWTREKVSRIITMSRTYYSPPIIVRSYFHCSRINLVNLAIKSSYKDQEVVLDNWLSIPHSCSLVRIKRKVFKMETFSAFEFRRPYVQRYTLRSPFLWHSLFCLTPSKLHGITNLIFEVSKVITLGSGLVRWIMKIMSCLELIVKEYGIF